MLESKPLAYLNLKGPDSDIDYSMCVPCHAFLAFYGVQSLVPRTTGLASETEVRNKRIYNAHRFALFFQLNIWDSFKMKSSYPHKLHIIYDYELIISWAAIIHILSSSQYILCSFTAMFYTNNEGVRFSLNKFTSCIVFAWCRKNKT